MSFENENILTNFDKRQELMQRKVDANRDRAIYRRYNDFGARDGRKIKNMFPKIADFLFATRPDKLSTQNGIVRENT